ncbi:hypothetical protein [Fibrella forsythiae]|uniref:Uncharacterized protein n=1 Tax=Fibrella forsythiae TaxID=2817061 RepID=A0ABS3JAC9_9BACT|nr:hypothetical protein [Fibrella forsythiae]MBO0946956.1 hypothetical protein [Fibrella forsythiae]
MGGATDLIEQRGRADGLGSAHRSGGLGAAPAGDRAGRIDLGFIAGRAQGKAAGEARPFLGVGQPVVGGEYRRAGTRIEQDVLGLTRARVGNL